MSITKQENKKSIRSPQKNVNDSENSRKQDVGLLEASVMLERLSPDIKATASSRKSLDTRNKRACVPRDKRKPKMLTAGKKKQKVCPVTRLKSSTKSVSSELQICIQSPVFIIPAWYVLPNFHIRWMLRFVN
jgi:hypothetical protein